MGEGRTAPPLLVIAGATATGKTGLSIEVARRLAERVQHLGWHVQLLLDVEDHGTLARTVDKDLDGARGVMAALATVGVDFGDVTKTLEEEGVASFSKSFDELITSLETKADTLKG